MSAGIKRLIVLLLAVNGTAAFSYVIGRREATKICQQQIAELKAQIPKESINAHELRQRDDHSQN